MPTYALLGATGSTGSAIVRSLIKDPPKDLTLNIFIRSKSKLLKTFPDLETATAFKANIIEGVPSDTTALQTCLKDATVIFGCIGTNEPTAGMTLIHDTITSIISALQHRREVEGSAYQTPTVIQLRSSSLNPNSTLPQFSRSMAWFFFYHIYTDLDKGCNLLISNSSSKDSTTTSPQLLDYIFVDPPSIHDADGTETTGHKLFTDMSKETQEPAISYADLGAAFCEVAQRRKEFAGQGVFVSATGKVRMTWGPLMGFMRKGLWSRVAGFKPV